LTFYRVGAANRRLGGISGRLAVFEAQIAGAAAENGHKMARVKPLVQIA
jgi:hypothetical protein